jgi:hypothetical protein
MRRSTLIRSRSRAPRRARPALEALEGRALLSTFTVLNLADSGPGSLRQAILAANANPGADVIGFAGGLKGTIPLASELSVTDDLTINGPGANQLTVSGNNATRVFHVSGTSLAINDLTIANGLASVPAGNALGGGLLNDGASVTLSKVLFAGNQAVGHGAGGGAVANIGGARLTADHTDFLGNTASADGNDNADGGAVYDDQDAVVDVEHGTFSGNLVTGGNANGGAIGHYNGSQLTLDHCSFAGNQAHAIPPGSTLALDATGGAIESDALVGFFPVGPALATLTITHCSFTGNLAVAEAGGSAEAGALGVDPGATGTVSYSNFEGNRARAGDGSDGGAGSNGGAGGTSGGGAIFTANADLSVSHSRFSGNETHGGNGGQGGDGGGNGGAGNRGLGGAINANFAGANFPGGASRTLISDCLFAGNRAIGGDGGPGGSGGNGGPGARGDAGAIINLIGAMTVSDCAIVQNVAQGGAGGAPGSGGAHGGDGGLGRGGGFSNELGGEAKLTHTSILANQAIGGAGAVGGNGGNALGGGVYNGRFFNGQVANLELIDCAVSANLAQGGAGGAGGNGGYALGGGICNANTSPTGGLITTDPFPALDLDGTIVTANQAAGGAAGSGGVVGAGVGGGLYNQAGAVAEADAFTFILGNKASTSDDDVFGVLTPI